MPTFEGQTADQVWIQALQLFRDGRAQRVPDTRTGATREVLHAQFVIAIQELAPRRRGGGRTAQEME